MCDKSTQPLSPNSIIIRQRKDLSAPMGNPRLSGSINKTIIIKYVPRMCRRKKLAEHKDNGLVASSVGLVDHSASPRETFSITSIDPNFTFVAFTVYLRVTDQCQANDRNFEFHTTGKSNYIHWSITITTLWKTVLAGTPLFHSPSLFSPKIGVIRRRCVKL